MPKTRNIAHIVVTWNILRNSGISYIVELVEIPASSNE